MGLCMEYLSSDDEPDAALSIASLGTSSDTTAVVASSSFAGSSFSTGPAKGLNEDHCHVDGYQDETDDIASVQRDESLPAARQDRELLRAMPQADQTESATPELLLNDFVGDIELQKAGEDSSVADLKDKATDSLDDLDLEDIPGVPPNMESFSRIESLGQDYSTPFNGPDEPAFALHYESLQESTDVPLYHPGGGKVDSIFELVPLNPVLTPYFWMMEKPRQFPEIVQSPTEKRVHNVDGEKEVEWAIKSFVPYPEQFFLISTSVKILVRFRHEKLITEQACAGLLFRCVNGNPRLWEPIKNAFISKDFLVVRCSDRGNNNTNPAVDALYANVQKTHTMKFTKTLRRLLEALLALRRGKDCYLVCKKTRKAVAADLRQEGCLDISEEFMSRHGDPWPFRNVSPTQADKFGLSEPLAFEEVFGNAEYLAREQAILENKEDARQEETQNKNKTKKKQKKDKEEAAEEWEFPAEEATMYLDEAYEAMGFHTTTGPSTESVPRAYQTTTSKCQNQ